jgi:hypothetical protein
MSVPKSSRMGLRRVQNGFVRDRNFVDNIVDLDGHARIASQAAVACPRAFAARPGLAAWEYAAAFPSLSHIFMKNVLLVSGALLGVLNFGEVLYAIVLAYVKTAVDNIFLFAVCCGVLQWCPLERIFVRHRRRPHAKAPLRRVQANQREAESRPPSGCR